jgi:hypothetical protein
MGDDDGGGAKAFVDLGQHLQHGHAGLAVERARGFIAQQDFGAFGDGARDGHALLFPARQLGWEMVAPWAKPDAVQRLGRIHGVWGHIGDKLHILARRQRGDEIVELKHKAHMVAPVARQRPVAQTRQFQIAKPDAPGRNVIKPAQDIEKRGFARTRGAEQHRKLAGIQFQIDASQRMHLDPAGVIDLGQALGAKDDLWVRGHDDSLVAWRRLGRVDPPQA